MIYNSKKENDEAMVWLYFGAPVIDDFAAPLWVLREWEVPFRFRQFFHCKVS
jgi:hypothetical protein